MWDVRHYALAFLAGVVGFLQLPQLPSPAWALGIVPVALGARRHPILRLALVFALACLWTGWRAQIILAQRLPLALEGRDLYVEGVVASIPERSARSQRFNLDVVNVSDPRAASLGRIRLHLYNRELRPGAGERWRLRVRLKQPRGLRNPAGFDYGAWLFRNAIGATGYVRRDAQNRRLQAGTEASLLVVRARIAARIDSVLAGQPQRGLVTALAVGQRGDITATQWQTLVRTGTSHLMAISGLHVGLIAALGFWLGAGGWARLPGAAGWCAAPRIGAGVAVALAAAYSALAGFAIPAQRALVMLSVGMALLWWVGRRIDASVALAGALLAVLLWDPVAVLAPGFWLSFFAVVILLWAARRRTRSALRRIVRIQWGLAIGLAPAVLFWFQQVSVVSPLTNLIAVPVVGLLTVPLTLIGVGLELGGAGPAAAYLFHMAVKPVALLWPVLEWAGGLDQAAWLRSAPPLWVLASALVGAGWLLGPAGIPARWLGLVWILPLLLRTPAIPEPGALWLTILDVGQGLAVVAQTRRHLLVYDTGPRYSERFDTGQAVVLPFLTMAGVQRVDRLIVSHGDNDHSGGARAVLAGMAVTDVLSGQVIDGVPGRACRAGQRWRWDGVEFRILHPLGRSGGPANNRSCVLRIASVYGSILLPGDIDRRAEQALLTRPGGVEPVTVLIAPHHGSKSSSSAAFLRALAPAVVVFTTGYRNRYRHPHRAVLERYAALNARRFDTARDGAVQIRFDKGAAQIVALRRAQRRLWDP